MLQRTGPLILIHSQTLRMRSLCNRKLLRKFGLNTRLFKNTVQTGHHDMTDHKKQLSIKGRQAMLLTLCKVICSVALEGTTSDRANNPHN